MSSDVAAAASRIANAGRAAWPDVKISETTIANRLAARLQDDPDARLESLHDSDLYLAMALAEGDQAALKAFEAELVPQIDVALRRLRLAGGTADEVKQSLRYELLVSRIQRLE